MPPAERNKAIQSALVVRLRDELAADLPEMLRQLDLLLLDSWPGLTDEAHRSAARNAQRWLHGQVETLAGALIERLVRALQAKPGAGQEVDAKDLSFLTLMDERGLDLSATRINTVNQILSRCRLVYGELEARLDALNGDGPLLDTRSLAPGRVIDEFRTAAQDMGASTDMQAALLKALSRLAPDLLLHLYYQLNSQLAGAGLLPELEVTNVHSLASAHQLTPGQVARSLEVMLRDMQPALESLPGQDWHPGQLRQLVQKHFNADAYACLSARQKSAISELESSFRRMLDTPEISLRFRAQLKRLLLPLLTLRLTQPGLFENPHSPVRALMQQLAVLGTLDEFDPIEDFYRIVAVVDRIVSENGQEQEGFRAGSQALYTLLHGTATGTRRGSPATVKAREAVLKDLKILHQRPPPTPPLQRIVDALMIPWMIKIYESFGEESKASISALVSAHLFFDAIDSTGVSLSEQERRELGEEVLEDVESWISQSELPRPELDEMRREMRRSLGF